MPDTDHTPPKTCDNTSVGVIIHDPDRGLLMFERATFPPGIAPVAGHIDQHGGVWAAARAEVSEELGLTITSMDAYAGGWRDNRCRRTPGPAGVGHGWRVFKAEVTGTLVPSARETRNARWITPTELTDLIHRTRDYATGRITPADFTANPGIEPVWVRWLWPYSTAVLTTDDLDRIDATAAVPPWLTALPPTPPEMNFVTICGSTRFWDLMAEVECALTWRGYIVLRPGCNMKKPHPLWADPAQAEAGKARLDALHRDKIAASDWVIVVGDYIGDSTRSEIKYAKSLGTPIHYTHPQADPGNGQ